MARISMPKFLKLGEDVWDPSHRFETSWLMSPWKLFACRAALSLYAFTTLFFNIGWKVAIHDDAAARLSFSYFTIITYWGLAFYFLFASIHTFSYALNSGMPLLNRWPRFLQALHYLFYSTITTYPLLVTIVFWCVLADDTTFGTTYSSWSNVSQHALNSAFALFEIVFTRVNPGPWIHLLWCIVLLVCYLGVAYITHDTEGVYVYSFLNDQPKLLNAAGENIGGIGVWAAAYICGIAIGIVVLFCVSKGLIHLRKWATETKGGIQGKLNEGRALGSEEMDLQEPREWQKTGEVSTTEA
ncbi:hypothetical protein BJ878DRAFT_484541 [Calycina marina]|uniref:Uncharacterized protein n=1 Tax=Calycina marina TaxID=1763456 RepID=A0A9P7ZBR2_9HELO|nr:hypothetical protein BJ878DRAFT_484541 [Calycina marina]